MRRVAAVALTAGLLVSIGLVSAVSADPAGQDGLMIQPAQPAGVPVPDGPVVERKELEGGLIIEDIRIGDGYQVKAGGAVVAHYHGTLREGGKVFDSSFQRGQPVPFPLTGVIEGWQKGVPGMKVGGVRRITIPAAMGYGERGAGSEIPPNSDLVFVIELIDAVQIEDITPGEGEETKSPFVAVTTHIMRDTEGNVVAKVEKSDPYLWIPDEFTGLQYGMEGMKPGGKRRIKVPSQMNQPYPGLTATRPTGIPLVIEVELVARRNLPRG